MTDLAAALDGFNLVLGIPANFSMLHWAKNRFVASALVVGLGLAVYSASGAPGRAPTKDQLFASVPLYFEPLDSSTSPGGFVARGGNYQFLLRADEVMLALSKIDSSASSSPFERDSLTAPRAMATRTLRMSFPGCNAKATLAGLAQGVATVNYFVGADPAQWRKGVATFSKVRVGNLYPGIDLVYYGNQQKLEYDFVIGPHVDPRLIAIRFQGADNIRVTPEGELVLRLGSDQVRQPAPRLYQVVKGAAKEVRGSYRFKDPTTVEFAVGEYDPDLPLIIDPILGYSSYFGGNAGDISLAIKVHTNSGSVYIAGQTLSTSFPFTVPPGALQTNFHGGTINGDAFVAKFDQTLTNLLYLTYFGGTANDAVLDLAVDDAGNAFITGFTESTNLPTANALFSRIAGTFDPKFNAFPIDAFIAELNPSGSQLVYSTYLGGSDTDIAGGIAVGPGGTAYVTGYTTSTNFPTTNAAFSVFKGSRDVFIAAIGAGGTPLIYSTYMGGTNVDEGEGIAVDNTGVAYVTGYTSSTNFPTTNAFRTLLNSGTNAVANDVFVARFSPGGALTTSTFLGGTNSDAGFRIALDAANAAYVTGSAGSPDFPNTATNIVGLRVGATGSNSFNSDAFLAKITFSSNVATLAWSSLFGGTKDDTGWGLAVDAVGDAFVIGLTLSTNFPVLNTNDFLRATNSGRQDLFVTAFDAGGNALLYSAYLGGSGDDYGYGIALDSADNAFITGRTLSTDFPVVGGFQGSLTGPNDAVIAKIVMDAPPTLSTFITATGLILQWPVFAPDYGLEYTTNVSSTAVWLPFGLTPPPTNGLHSVLLAPTNGATFFRLRR
jgi:hypothetical protein